MIWSTGSSRNNPRSSLIVLLSVAVAMSWQFRSVAVVVVEGREGSTSSTSRPSHWEEPGADLSSSSSSSSSSTQRQNQNKDKSKHHTNVVILLADNLAYDDVGVFRGAHENRAQGDNGRSRSSRTPNLDKAAREGRRLLNWNSPAVLCSASRAALLTGKYPVRTGIYPRVFEQDAAHGLMPNETTLADCLRTEGYATKIVGKWHLGQRPEYLPTQRGFERWFGIPYHMSGGSLEDHICEGKDPAGKLWLPLFDGTTIVEQPVVPENLAPRYVNESISFFKQSIEEDRPFFLYLAFSHVHQLCAPRQSECQWASTHFSRNKTKSGYNATFGDALEEMDWIAGEVLKGLGDLGVEENTLVVFTSDNGPWVAEGSCAGSKGPFQGRWLSENVNQNCTACPSEYIPAPLPGQPRRCVFPGPNSNVINNDIGNGNSNKNNHGSENVYEIEGIHCGEDTGLGSAWEANVRMPAFVKWPGGKIPKGSETMEMVTTLDVLPTVLGLLGVQTLPSGIDGIDVSDVFLGKGPSCNGNQTKKDDRPVFFWRDGFASGPLPLPFGRFDVVAMKIGSIKAWFYTKSSHYNSDAEVYHDPPLLFDVLRDPAESRPLDPNQHSSWIAHAKDLLEKHKDSVDWTEPLCLERDPKYSPCVDETTNCRTTPPPASGASRDGHHTANERTIAAFGSQLAESEM